ncbi:cdc25-like protein phosphatase twine-related [Anaeramoeba ignava]|uniref:protein-tyrosine-phosphatase n=1 Tax=Anaeramoeba ignava TaxID=1746090 RepID=A0A9Q0RE39_ANAIG|nr:cdc25-like protein phosphatase twine-related [Anaeramoeba ignava]
MQNQRKRTNNLDNIQYTALNQHSSQTQIKSQLAVQNENKTENQKQINPSKQSIQEKETKEVTKKEFCNLNSKKQNLTIEIKQQKPIIKKINSIKLQDALPKLNECEKSPNYTPSTTYNLKSTFSMPNLANTKNFDNSFPCLEKLVLSLTKEEPSELPTISPQTLLKVLNSPKSFNFDYIFVIDCRFSFEYEAGHIKGAKNWNDPFKIITNLFSEQIYENACLILHCEFSKNRAPSMFHFIRQIDHKCNPYPKLFYPQMYILGGGFRNFFKMSKENKEFCHPKEYLKMRDKDHSNELIASNNELKFRFQKITNFLQQPNFTIENLRLFCRKNKNLRVARSFSQPELNMEMKRHRSSNSHPQLMRSSSLSDTPKFLAEMKVTDLHEERLSKSARIEEKFENQIFSCRSLLHSPNSQVVPVSKRRLFELSSEGNSSFSSLYINYPKDHKVKTRDTNDLSSIYFSKLM